MNVDERWQRIRAAMRGGAISPDDNDAVLARKVGRIRAARPLINRQVELDMESTEDERILQIPVPDNMPPEFHDAYRMSIAADLGLAPKTKELLDRLEPEYNEPEVIQRAKRAEARGQRIQEELPALNATLQEIDTGGVQTDSEGYAHAIKHAGPLGALAHAAQRAPKSFWDAVEKNEIPADVAERVLRMEIPDRSQDPVKAKADHDALEAMSDEDLAELCEQRGAEERGEDE